MYIRGHLLTFISLHKKLYVEKLGYTVKFQEAAQSSNAVSSTCLLPKVLSSHAIEWSKTKRWRNNIQY